MPQGGSPQRSKGLKRKGPVLIERVENTLSNGQNNAKIASKWGSNPNFRHSDQTFRTRAWCVAPCRLPPLRRLENFTLNAYLHTSFYV